MEPFKILVVGTGMYVTGRTTEGIGTILPSAMRFCSTTKRKTEITLLATSEHSKTQAINKAKQAIEILGLDVQIKFASGNVEEHLNGNCYQCAILATPDATHFEIASELIKNKIHTLVVKPLASTLEEVSTLVSMAKKSGVYGMVEFHKRFDRSNLYLKTVVEDKQIGDPLYFLVQYSQKKVIPEVVFEKWLDQTNIFQYLGIHYVDIIYFATGAKPKRVLSLGQESYLKSKGIKNYDSIQTLVEWEREDGHKFTSSFLTNWVEEESAPAMSDQRIKVIGTRGRLEENQKDRGIQIVSQKGYEQVNPDFCRLYKKGEHYDIDGYGVKSITTFLDDVMAIINGEATVESFEKCRPTFSQSIIPTKVIEASNESLKLDGQWVNVE